MQAILKYQMPTFVIPVHKIRHTKNNCERHKITHTKNNCERQAIIVLDRAVLMEMQMINDYIRLPLSACIKTQNPRDIIGPLKSMLILLDSICSEKMFIQAL